MNTLKFITAGNVDDGKSTLIGRLLYDSDSIHTDQLGLIQKQSKRQEGEVDLALITDGLRAEREQGITIDVAYKYFSTSKRKFIIADAPGHEQYTRNMITGASNADLIILLIDARKGITEQTKRHASIGALMGIKHAVVAINKMDLVGYNQNIFENIMADFENKKSNLSYTQITYIPLNALHGDNVVKKSTAMPWYTGEALLPFLESVVVDKATSNALRFQVQWVVRPHEAHWHDYRGYAGNVLSGTLRAGQAVRLWPSQITTHISKIERHQEEVLEAVMGQNVVLHLGNDLDASRGDTLTEAAALIQCSSQIESWLCWLDTDALQIGKTYLLQHRFRTVRVKVQTVLKTWDIKEWQFQESGNNLKMNDIAQVVLRTNQPLFYDAFAEVPSNGNAILIDETSYNTVAACMFL